jgi:sulfofructosephosphate aldolase
VAASCRGGASGLLAGRGVWRAALATDDPEAELATHGRQRLRALLDVVDAEARPWRSALHA